MLSSYAPAIEKLEIEGEGGEERWSSVVPHFKPLQILVIRKPGTAQVKTAKEELDERLPLPKRREHARHCLPSSLGPLNGRRRKSLRSSSSECLPCPPKCRLLKRSAVAPSIFLSPPLPTLTMSPIRRSLREEDRS